MNGGRGAKGSINDRLISMMYRNRYKKFQLKKEAYRKTAKIREREFLKSVQNFDMADGTADLDEQDKLVVSDALDGIKLLDEKEMREIDTLQDISATASSMRYGSDETASNLHQLSEKMLETDFKVEGFDFENYDYYTIINSRLGAKVLDEDEVIDVEREITKVDDEITIVSELEDFIADSLDAIDEIKSDIDSLRSDVQDKYTSEQMEEIQERYQKIKKKVEKLKLQYEAVSQKYNFEDFHLLESLTMASAIDEYRDLATLDEVETLVDYCKEEIEQIDGIVLEHEKMIATGGEIDEKTGKIKKREEDFDKNKAGVIYLDDLEQRIAYEANEQREMIALIEKKLDNFKSEVVEVTDVVFHTEKLFGSFLRIAAGILTAPFSGRKIFGTYLGAQLINKGVRDLRASLEPDYVKRTEIVHSYTSVENEILNSMDHVNDTLNVIVDSLEQLELFEEEFKEKFKDYSHLISEYSQLERQISTLKRRLQKKEKEVIMMKQDLSKQYEQNKVKVKKAA